MGQKPRLTVDEVFGRYWLEEGQHKVTAEKTYSDLSRFKSFFGANTLWHKLDNDDISRFIADRRTQRVPVVRNFKDGSTAINYTDRLISNATINRELSMMRRINSYCKDNWDHTPAKFNIKRHLLEIKDVEKPYFTREQQKAIIEHLPEHCKCAFRFALYTGVRAQNILGGYNNSYDRAVRRRDVFLEERFIRFKVKSKKPGGKTLEVPIIEENYRMLVDELKIEGLRPEEYLFTYPGDHRHAGKPLGNYRKAFYQAMEASGFNRKVGDGFHITRHTAASMMVNSGVDLAIVQEVLGHSNIEITRRYAHRNLDSKKQAMEKALTSQFRHNEQVTSESNAKKLKDSIDCRCSSVEEHVIGKIKELLDSL